MEENLKKERGSEKGMERRRRVVVRGEVQDVGFRLFLYENASAMDISEFYARNIPEGVEVLVGGPDAEKFVAFVRDARFERGEIREVIAEEYTGKIMPIERFAQNFMLSQMSKFVSVGLDMLKTQREMLENQRRMLENQHKMLENQDKMLENQCKMLEKQDLMLEKQDKMLEKQDKMLEKQDLMLEKQDETVREIRALRQDLKAYIEERFAKIEQEIAEIKSKLGML